MKKKKGLKKNQIMTELIKRYKMLEKESKEKGKDVNRKEQKKKGQKKKEEKEN